MPEPAKLTWKVEGGRASIISEKDIEKYRKKASVNKSNHGH
jgi:hypothetical protein